MFSPFLIKEIYYVVTCKFSVQYKVSFELAPPQVLAKKYLFWLGVNSQFLYVFSFCTGGVFLILREEMKVISVLCIQISIFYLHKKKMYCTKRKGYAANTLREILHLLLVITLTLMELYEKS